MLDRRTFTVALLGGAGLAVLMRSEVGQAAESGAYRVVRTDEEWRKLLTPEQYYVLRQHGTERAFTSPLDKNYAAGDYHCAGCETKLFTSKTKFNSRTGWPSFYAPEPGVIGEKVDRSYFMVRTEVHCAACGGHQGHVFDDGPPPTGKRYCINGVALKFVPSQPS